MYPMKISKSFHKIQKKTNIDIFYHLPITNFFVPFHSVTWSYPSQNVSRWTLRKSWNDNIISLLFTKKMWKFLIEGIYYLYISLVALKRADKRFWRKCECLDSKHPVDSGSYIKSENKETSNQEILLNIYNLTFVENTCLQVIFRPCILSFWNQYFNLKKTKKFFKVNV